MDATKILFHLAEAGCLEAAEAPAAEAASPRDRLASLTDGVNAVLREVYAAAAVHGGAETFLSGVRACLADPASRIAPLWNLVIPRPDGGLDPGQVLQNLSALQDAAPARIEPPGDPARFLHDGLRELAFFYLFLAGELLPRQEDETLGERVRERLLALEGLR